MHAQIVVTRLSFLSQKPGYEAREMSWSLILMSSEAIVIKNKLTEIINYELMYTSIVFT